jgi:DNA-directed RNA polymerase subunit F
MPRKIRSKKEITVSEAKKLLEAAEEPNLFQLRTLEYAKKFSSMDSSKAEELVDLLMDRFMVDRKDAVQVVNCLPGSIQELRAFFSTGRKRIILTSQLEDMLKILDTYR